MLDLNGKRDSVLIDWLKLAFFANGHSQRDSTPQDNTVTSRPDEEREHENAGLQEQPDAFLAQIGEQYIASSPPQTEPTPTPPAPVPKEKKTSHFHRVTAFR